MYEKKKGGKTVKKNKNLNESHLNDTSYFSFWMKIRM